MTDAPVLAPQKWPSRSGFGTRNGRRGDGRPTCRIRFGEECDPAAESANDDIGAWDTSGVTTMYQSSTRPRPLIKTSARGGDMSRCSPQPLTRTSAQAGHLRPGSHAQMFEGASTLTRRPRLVRGRRCGPGQHVRRESDVVRQRAKGRKWDLYLRLPLSRRRRPSPLRRQRRPAAAAARPCGVIRALQHDLRRPSSSSRSDAHARTGYIPPNDSPLLYC